MYKFIITVCLCMVCMHGCAGVFTSDDKLLETYSLSVSDNNMTIFYTPAPSNTNIAIKNTGNAFMNNLSVSFTCTENGNANTIIYSLGNLKPYFNKTLSVPFIISKCNLFTVGYTFTPYKDGGFIDNNRTTNNDFNFSSYSLIEGLITIK